jgi:hypothetical protein
MDKWEDNSKFKRQAHLKVALDVYERNMEFYIKECTLHHRQAVIIVRQARIDV